MVYRKRHLQRLLCDINNIYLGCGDLANQRSWDILLHIFMSNEYGKTKINKENYAGELYAGRNRKTHMIKGFSLDFPVAFILYFGVAFLKLQNIV